MQFLKKFFKHDSVIGLCGLKKQTQYVQINIPQSYKMGTIQNTKNNYLLI